LRGFAGEVGFLRRSFGPGWALVGDAAYFKDPITAHGITDALRDAELLARAVAEASDAALAAYQDTRDAMALALFEVTDDIASYEWDLAAVQQLHFALSNEMKREVKEMADLLARAPEEPRRDLQPPPAMGGAA
jgi:flavin-dependent dehydrogenase